MPQLAGPYWAHTVYAGWQQADTGHAERGAPDGGSLQGARTVTSVQPPTLQLLPLDQGHSGAVRTLNSNPSGSAKPLLHNWTGSLLTRKFILTASSLCVFFRQWQLLRPQHGLKQKKTRWCVHSCCSSGFASQASISSRQHYVRCLCTGTRQASAEAARGQAIQPSSSPAPHRGECPPSLRGCLTVCICACM